MRFLITGSTGFIGPHLIKKLISRSDQCRCLVRSEKKSHIFDAYGVEIVKGDVTKPETLNGIADGVDVILHLATLGHMSNHTVPEKMFETINVQGTLNMMREGLRAGVKKFIHCSSVAAMGIIPNTVATEETPCQPHHAYGRSKLKAEKEVLRFMSEQGLPTVIIRFSMVYGPGDWRDILKLTRLKKKGLFPQIGCKPKLTPLIHVQDAVDGLLLAAEKGRPGEIYLLTNPESQPFDKIGQIIHNALGRSRPSLYLPEWMAMLAASLVEKTFPLIGKVPPVTRKNIESTLADRVFSIEKARKELGFNPAIDPEKGLYETVLWYKEQGWV